jgi:hypothetical protein
MAGKEIQAAIYRELQRRFDPDLVKSEWSARKLAADAFADPTTYAPRLDIAVGPFNLSFENRYRDAHEIRIFGNALVDRIKQEISEQNDHDFRENQNPRCLIAIEIEHNTSSKHILGGITNASMLGYLGVIVGSTEYVKKIERIHTYARKLKEVEKAPNDMFGNVACFEEREFMRLIRKRGR